MMHRSNDRGTFVIDRIFDGVGRIRRASGTTDRATFRAIDAMLTVLHVQARHDLLQGIRDGKLKGVYVLSWFRQQRVDRIPTADVLVPLKERWSTWVTQLQKGDDAVSPEHVRSIGITLRAIGAGADHTLHELPGLVAAYAERGPRRMVQLARAHAMAFIRDVLGPSHALWAALKDVRVPKQKTDRKGRPLSRDEVGALLERFGADGAGETWSMIATGMHQKEYWGDWVEHLDRIAIHGTKRVGRDRVVPRWAAVHRPTMTRRRWEIRLRELTGGAIMPRDLRRTFARWTEEAGIIESNARAYMGHGARTMSQLYRLGELPGQLEGDAAKLRAYYGDAPNVVPVLKAVGEGPIRPPISPRTGDETRGERSRGSAVVVRSSRGRTRTCDPLINSRQQNPPPPTK
jgi:integrase